MLPKFPIRGLLSHDLGALGSGSIGTAVAAASLLDLVTCIATPDDDPDPITTDPFLDFLIVVNQRFPDIVLNWLLSTSSRP